MSTDIIKFQIDSLGKSKEIFQVHAIQVYMAITLPLTFLVFASWYGVYWWVDRKDRLNKKKVGLLRGASGV